MTAKERAVATLSPDGTGTLELGGNTATITADNFNAARMQLMTRVRDRAMTAGVRVTLEAHSDGDTARITFLPDGTMADTPDAPEPDPDAIRPAPVTPTARAKKTRASRRVTVPTPTQPASATPAPATPPAWSAPSPKPLPAATGTALAPYGTAHTPTTQAPPAASQATWELPNGQRVAASTPERAAIPATDDTAQPREPITTDHPTSAVDALTELFHGAPPAHEPAAHDEPVVPHVPPIPVVPAPRIPAPALPAAGDALSPAAGADSLPAEVEQTRLGWRATEAQAPARVLTFSTGDTATVTGRGLIGRGPRGDGTEQRVTVHDPLSSVSRTHLEFGFDGDAFWILDRDSANGTYLRVGNQEHPCVAGRRYFVEDGDVVSIGDVTFTTTRKQAR